MEVLRNVDPSMMIGLGLASMMGICVLVLFTMRDRSWTPPRLYTQLVTCQPTGRPARIRIVEQLQRGEMVRSVQRCSLWAYGRRTCHEECLQSIPAG
jgi:hypothetical protein